ncbi:MAG: hypothetical protein V4642_09490 [Bacteroidota bacterium]
MARYEDSSEETKKIVRRIFILFFPVIFGCLILNEFYEKYTEVWPFSKGMFESNINGKVDNIKVNRGAMIVTLDNQQIFYFRPKNIYSNFSEIVRPSDSLWKSANNDTIFTFSGGQILSFPFETTDKFGKIYRDTQSTHYSIF